MSTRPTLAALIERVRLLVNDEPGANQVYSDLEIQNALDMYRRDIQYLELDAQPRYTPSGTEYRVYYTDVFPWETAELVDGGWNVLTPAVADLDIGRWEFSTSQSPPVYVSGIVHDIYAAAALLLERRAASEALSFDVDADGHALKRSQKHSQLLKLAAAYRAMARPATIRVRRGDVT